jgi:hypothetical protein
MTVEPRSVSVRIVQPPPSELLDAKSFHPSSWHMLDNIRFSEAIKDLPKTTRKKAQKKWKSCRPYVHLVSAQIPATLHTCREARGLGLYQQISLDLDEANTARRYVWLNPDIDLIDIGTTSLEHYVPIAQCFKRLKLRREAGDEYWYHFENETLPAFSNVEEIHVVCEDGFCTWGDSVDEYPWPCAWEKLVFIDESLPEGRAGVGYQEMDRIYFEMLEQW